MILKNESKIILSCLESLAPYIDYYIICDTGSSDDTPYKVKQFFEQKGISGEIIAIDFLHFEQARNTALQYAQNSPVDFDYILFCDADMQLKVLDADFKTRLTSDYYYVIQKNVSLNYANIRLVKKHIPARYRGVTHEYLECEGEAGELAEVYFWDSACGSSRAHKFERDIQLITQALKSDPDNLRYWFYLAQTYFDQEQYQLALEAYQKRIQLGGWEEEVFYSHFRIGKIWQALNDEARMLQAFLEAYNFRPIRAEPLYELARHYRIKSQYNLGYLFARTASEISYPVEEKLFIFRDVYQFQALDERAVCAWWIGKYQESADIYQELLAKNCVPASELERVKNNLAFALERL